MENSFQQNYQTEIEILSRDYSPLRSSHKWKSTKIPSAQLNSDTVSLLNQKEKFTVQRAGSDTTDIYSLFQFNKRMQNKRSEKLLQSAFSFWRLINPSQLRSISKPVYIKVFENIYKDILDPNNTAYAKEYAINDAEIDFNGNFGLTFCEFYDSFFEFLDTMTKSVLIGEYLRFIKAVYSNIQEAAWFSALNLHNKLHLSEAPRPIFQSWMVKSFRETRQTMVENTSLSPPKAASVKIDLDNLQRKNRKIVREANQVQRKIEILKRQIRSSQSRVRSRSTLDGRYNWTVDIDKKDRDWSTIKKDSYLDKFNPLSIKPLRGGRDSNFLEEIIQLRKGKTIEMLN
ncbi:unnamed protein product [Blepharisma stoltei]|uniref:Uncharacterized protein n=1 Tax=Blepharisma stoltei TaxID=1481888 RepID=A0AAU9JPF4_9CILI|nr:unnamed protein product [Blepharisma stoltei]